MGFVHTKVAKDFVERWPNVQLTPETAAAVNKLTVNPGNLRADFNAPILQQILGGE